MRSVYLSFLFVCCCLLFRIESGGAGSKQNAETAINTARPGTAAFLQHPKVYLPSHALNLTMGSNYRVQHATGFIDEGIGLFPHKAALCRGIDDTAGQGSYAFYLSHIYPTHNFW